ncbi:MAG: TIGR04211 family SH3 domain-containing protein [Halioglobus sp.]|nr:TIGR04211 family SH3 domain-containing protein [Halioglobus sp.]
MRLPLCTLLLSLLLSLSIQAAEIRYVSDKQFVPLRSGAGSNYRIVHRGIPSGTRLTVNSSLADGSWSEVTMENGKSGWIQPQYLMPDLPARLKLVAMTAEAEKTAARNIELEAQLNAINAERDDLISQVTGSDFELSGVSRELHELKKISGKSVQLDKDNRRLVEESENLRSEVEMLEAERLRLQDKLESEDFMNGAMAVLLGVIIALVAPRLIPKRRKNSSWA